MSSGKTSLMEGQKAQTDPTPRVCAAFDQSRDFLLLMNNCSEHFCSSLCSCIHKNYHKRVQTADLG